GEVDQGPVEPRREVPRIADDDGFSYCRPEEVSTRAPAEVAENAHRTQIERHESRGHYHRSQSKGLPKQFNGVTGAENLFLRVRWDEICGYVGPNGAGKTLSYPLTKPSTD